MIEFRILSLPSAEVLALAITMRSIGIQIDHTVSIEPPNLYTCPMPALPSPNLIHLELAGPCPALPLETLQYTYSTWHHPCTLSLIGIGADVHDVFGEPVLEQRRALPSLLQRLRHLRLLHSRHHPRKLPQPAAPLRPANPARQHSSDSCTCSKYLCGRDFLVHA